MKLGSKKKKYTSCTDEKKKKKNLNLIIVGVVTAGITVSIYQFGIVNYYCNKTRQETIKELTSDGSNYVQAYVLNKEIGKGTSITAEDVVRITRNSDIIPANYITDVSQLEGMVARIPLGDKTIISGDMVVKMEDEITDSIKNQDYSWITVHSFLQLNDYVDIHYKEVDGTDTIVAAKKKILNLNGKVFAIDISEEERAYINNATVKTAVSGGELYTSIYPDPENQKAASVTYKLDKQIEEQIKNDPNIVNQSAETIKEKNNGGNSESAQNDKEDESTSKVAENIVTVSKPEFAGGE